MGGVEQAAGRMKQASIANSAIYRNGQSRQSIKHLGACYLAVYMYSKPARHTYHHRLPTIMVKAKSMHTCSPATHVATTCPRRLPTGYCVHIYTKTPVTSEQPIFWDWIHDMEFFGSPHTSSHTATGVSQLLVVYI